MKPNPNLPSSPQYSGDDENTDATLITGVSPARSKSKSPEDRPSPPRLYSPEVDGMEVDGMEVDGMEVGGGSDEDQSTEEQRHGTKRARPEEESLGNQNVPLNSSEPVSKKRRAQESPTQAGESSINESLQAGADSGVRLLVKWTCEHLLTMNMGRTYQMGDTFSPNTFAHFRNALEQATKANAPDLILKLLETGMQNCIPEALDHALTMATSVGAHDVIALLSPKSSSSSSSATTLLNVCAPEQGWQKKINPECKNISLRTIINAIKNQKNSTEACKLLFGEDSKNWPKGEFRAETFENLAENIETLFDKCGAVCLEDDEIHLVLFGSDFDRDKFRQELLHMQALQNQEVNEGNLSRTTALMIAAQWGDLPTVQLLLQNGADPVAVNSTEKNALIFASSKGHFEIVSLLLTYPTNINSKDENEYTALSYAIKEGFLLICQLLFNHGASLANEEVSPLSLAAKNGDVEIYQLLIAKGADIHQESPDRSTPLSKAAAAGHLDACKLLVSKGADIDHINQKGFSILALAARSGSVELVEYFLAKGATLDNANRIHPPLMEAASIKNIDLVKIFIAHGASVNQPDLFGGTALFNSCKENSLEITTLLLQAGADPNIANRDKTTALTYAAMGGSIEIVKLLISYGATLFSDQHYGFKALSTAVKYGHIDVASYLLQMNVPAKSTASELSRHSLIIQTFNNNYTENIQIPMLRLLLSYGASLHGSEQNGNDALMLAVQNKKLNVISLLLDQGAKIGQLNMLSQNALHIAMDALNASLLNSTSQRVVDAEILARLLVNAQTQSDWLELRKEAIDRGQYPITREIILLSHVWPFVFKNLPNASPQLKHLELLEFDSFIQFAVTASPEILITQKIDYMLSLAGICPALIEFIRPYILALPQIKSHLLGNSSTIYPEIGLSFRTGMLATLEKIWVEYGENWNPYESELSESTIFNLLNQWAKSELNQLIEFATTNETTKTALVFESLFETCYNFTVPAPSVLHILPTYTAEAGALADALMRQGVYLSLATKIEQAWQAAWSPIAGKKMINDSGGSSSSSNSSSISPIGSQAPIVAIDPDDNFGVYDFDLRDHWLDQLFVPMEPATYLNSPQGQDLLKAFRHELRLAVDQVGKNILELPKGATEVTAEAAKIYADLMFRQLHMLKQFIEAE